MNELGAALNREDSIAYCRVSQKPLTEECEQILAAARDEQLQPLLLWGGAISNRPRCLVGEANMEEATIEKDSDISRSRGREVGGCSVCERR